jgi:diacylglycerol kinase (ATP)
MRVTLIHNPEAGGEGQPSAEDLVRLIRENGTHSVLYQSSKHADWRSILDERSDLIAVAGGDGVVGLVAEHLVGRHMPFTILPMGTANNIATALGLKGRPLDQLIAGWPGARRLKFNVGVANGPWGANHFIEGVGTGAFADTMSRLDARRNADLAHHEEAGKKIHTTLHILKIRLEACPARRLKINLDGRDLSGDYILLEAMNISSIGPNLNLAPNADFGDDLLDIVLVSEHERANLTRYLVDSIAGKKISPVLTRYTGRLLRIESDELRVHIDDDIWPEHGEHPPYAPMIIDVSLHSDSIGVLVPE